MAETDPRVLLDEIKARADGATEGPWESDGEPNAGYWIMGADGRDLFTWDGSDIGLLIATEADAEFIANARTDLPDMAAALTAVLGIPAELDDPAGDAEAQGFANGHNAALALVHHVITNKLVGDRG